MWIGGAKASWATALHLFLLIQGGVCLRDVSISVPRAVLAGADARAVLRCEYSLEGAALYALRWYRVTRGGGGAGGAARGRGGGEPAHVEFYRYVPREHPPHLVFPLAGSSVDLSVSDGTQAVLTGLHRQLSGEFACEVSADAPLFQTEIRIANLTVVEPPFRAPVVEARVWTDAESGEGEVGEWGHEGMVVGGKRRDTERQGTGTRVRARCTSDASYPPANLTWTLDGQTIAMSISPDPAPDDFSEREAHSELELLLSAHDQGDESETAGDEPISVKMVGNRHTVRVLRDGASLRMGCAASLLGVWRRTSDVTLYAPVPALHTTHAGGSSLRWSLSALLLLLLVTSL